MQITDCGSGLQDFAERTTHSILIDAKTLLSLPTEHVNHERVGELKEAVTILQTVIDKAGNAYMMHLHRMHEVGQYECN